MKILNIKPIYFAALVLFSVSCTDLEVEELDSRLIEDESGEFSGVDPTAMLGTAYQNLRAFADQANTYALHEVTSDELLIPTRGTDWGDNGLWRTLHQHNWDATHPFVLASWEQLNSNVFRINQILHPKTTGATAQQIAEAKFLRAYNMYLVLDLFGQIPFRDADEGIEVDPVVYQPAEAFDFILTDLTEALPNLPEVGPGESTLTASKAAAHFLMAKLHLNKHVFLGTGSANDADMNVVIESVNAIKAAGFDLYEEGYFEIFEPGVDSETIFWTDASVGNRIWNGLHYHQQTEGNGGGGWNGFSTTAEFYALFEGPSETNEPGAGQEERRGFVPGPVAITEEGEHHIGYGFLVGQQYGPEGQALSDRAGRPLEFTKEFPGLIGNNERNGIRVIKYHPENGEFANHYILFRYADAHLMKAEALARQGNTAEALALVNELREIRDASPLTSLELSDLLDERGRELYIEGWRRNDQIRFGTYTDAWTLKPASEDFRRLFPIPANAVASNPNLEQNPGY
jgi:hypothetical protein